MSAHYSKYRLNTYYPTPYFRAHLPSGYPLDETLIRSRSFRRLPPTLRRLSGLAKQWATRKYPHHPAGMSGIEKWYDEDGYELNPRSGERLTDQEIDAEWDELNIKQSESFEVKDIPEPKGGFSDPDTWEEPESPAEDDDEDEIGEDRVLSEIKSHGRDYTARYYGVKATGSDEQLARAAAAVRARRGVKSAPESLRTAATGADSK